MNTTAHRRPRVLVVEDDPVARQLVVSALEDLDVMWTDSGLGFLECVLATGERTWDCNFDVIVSDVMLPDHDAFTILRVLRRKLVRTPVVLLTTNATEANRQRARAVDAAAFLPKPITPSALRTVVAKAIAESLQ